MSSSTNSGTPSALRDDLAEQRLGRPPAGRQPVDDRLRGGPAEPVEGERRGVRVAVPGRPELGPVGHDQQHRQALDPLHREVEQLERGRIDPMRVLEHHQHRASRRQPLELGEERPEGAGLLLLRRQGRQREAALGRQREELGEEGGDLGHVGDRAGEQRLELGELGRVVVGAGEARRPRELLDDRVERAVRVVRGAMVAEADPVLGAQPLAQGEDDPRLADAGLAREQHDLALAGPGEPPAVEEQRQLLVAADERGRAGAVERLEPAFRRPLAGHAEAAHGRGKALDLGRAEVGELEEGAEQPPRRLGDDNRAGLGELLQAGGEVRRLADDRLLLGRALARSDPRPRRAPSRCRRAPRAAPPSASSAARPPRRRRARP